MCVCGQVLQHQLSVSGKCVQLRDWTCAADETEHVQLGVTECVLLCSCNCCKLGVTKFVQWTEKK